MEDFPVRSVPSDVPAWTENYALAGYDVSQKVSVFLHMGRWRKDPSMWRELVSISLPDGTMIAHRGIGNARASETVPGSTIMQIEVLDDQRAQRWSALGGVRRLPITDLRDSILSDGPRDRLEFLLEFASDYPVWNVGKTSANSDMVGHGHVEQIGRLTGTISIGDYSVSIDTMANRDHSRGPRVMDRVEGHLWMHGIFEDGSHFQAYEAQEAGLGSVFSEATVFWEGTSHPGQLSVERRLTKDNPMDHIHDEFGFKIAYDGGSFDGKVSAYPQTMYYQYTAPWDSYLGVRYIDAGGNRRYIEQAILLERADGVRGYGHIERTVPGKLIVEA